MTDDTKNDTLPPAADTQTDIPSAPSEPPPPVIVAGQAQMALLHAFAHLARGLSQLEGVAVAIARALDATAGTETP
jgi:hypothetical protein